MAFFKGKEWDFWWVLLFFLGVFFGWFKYINPENNYG